MTSPITVRQTSGGLARNRALSARCHRPLHPLPPPTADPSENETNRASALQKVADLIGGLTFCTLTTVDERGALWSRPMAVQEKAFDGDLWFFTRGDSDKVAYVARNPQVGVAFADPDSQAYVTLSGTAEVIDDRQKAEDLWAEPLGTWFPDGVDDPHLRLIRVDTQRAEYWDPPSSAVVHLSGYAKAVLTGQKPGKNEVGDHETVDY